MFIISRSANHGDPVCVMIAFPDPMAVVDNRFRVYGVKNLRVIDASSIPVLTNGHPMAVLVAMAEKAADMIQEDRQGDKDTESASSSHASSVKRRNPHGKGN